MCIRDSWGFDPAYNSAIIGRYDDGDDSIGFHTDKESFLEHHFCANVTLGYSRDFQFKTINPDGTKQTHEIKLAHKSAFFFKGDVYKRQMLEKEQHCYNLILLTRQKNGVSF